MFSQNPFYSTGHPSAKRRWKTEVGRWRKTSGRDWRRWRKRDAGMHAVGNDVVGNDVVGNDDVGNDTGGKVGAGNDVVGNYDVGNYDVGTD